MCVCVPDAHDTFFMEQLTEALISAGLHIIKSVCSDYDYLTVHGIYLYSLFLILSATIMNVVIPICMQPWLVV